MKAAFPPLAWARAMVERARVVLPEDSGPNISTILPLGNPPTPKAMSNDKEPVDIASTFTLRASPNFMIASSPYLLRRVSRRLSKSLTVSSLVFFLTGGILYWLDYIFCLNDGRFVDYLFYQLSLSSEVPSSFKD